MTQILTIVNKQRTFMSSKKQLLLGKNNKSVKFIPRILSARFTSSNNSDAEKDNDYNHASNAADPSSSYLKNLMRSPSSWQTPDIPHAEKKGWQPSHNLDIQRVTQIAIIHELTQQQTRTIERIVPWFLDVMPVSSNTAI